ncbi:MAG: flavin reductase family protein [Alicyclobacillus sp.]|nr:flavin reductase family protein [Alicyclobacillus sp.]
MDPQEYRKAMSLFATGVTVVTTMDRGSVHGMTANAFTSVSLDPPLVLVSVDKRAETHALIPECEVFGINILRSDQEDFSRYFSKKDDSMKESPDLFEWIDGIPVLKDCLCRIACRLWKVYEGGDHSIFLGEVACIKASDGDPLLFFSSRYHRLR